MPEAVAKCSNYLYYEPEYKSEYKPGHSSILT